MMCSPRFENCLAFSGALYSLPVWYDCSALCCCCRWPGHRRTLKEHAHYLVHAKELCSLSASVWWLVYLVSWTRRAHLHEYGQKCDPPARRWEHGQGCWWRWHGICLFKIVPQLISYYMPHQSVPARVSNSAFSVALNRGTQTTLPGTRAKLTSCMRQRALRF